MAKAMKNATLEGISVGTAASLCVTVAESQGWTASLPSDRKIDLRRGGAIFGSAGMTIWLTDAGDDISLTCEGSEPDAEQLVDAVQAGVKAAVAGVNEPAQPDSGGSVAASEGEGVKLEVGSSPASIAIEPRSAQEEPAVTRALRNGAKTGVAFTLSAIFPGLGHLYLQSLVPGALLFVGQGAALYGVLYYSTVVQISDTASALDGTPPSPALVDRAGILAFMAIWIAVWIGALWSLSTSAAQARDNGVDN